MLWKWMNSLYVWLLCREILKLLKVNLKQVKIDGPEKGLPYDRADIADRIAKKIIKKGYDVQVENFNTHSLLKFSKSEIGIRELRDKKIDIVLK